LKACPPQAGKGYFLKIQWFAKFWALAQYSVILQQPELAEKNLTLKQN